ncbi:MAG: leucyl aminopeptidase [bacterium]
MEIRFSDSDPLGLECEALVVGAFSGEGMERDLVRRLDEVLDGLLSERAENGSFKGEEGSSLLLHRPAGVAARRLLLAGLGEEEHASDESVRRLGGMASRRLKDEGCSVVHVVLPRDRTAPGSVRACVEGFLLGPGGLGAYKTGEGSAKEDPYRGPCEGLVLVLPGEAEEEQREAALEGEVAGEAMILTRRLVNTPGNRMTPLVLGREAREACRETGVGTEILTGGQLEERGFGALMAVSRGSSQPPCFIIMRYLPEDDGEAARPPLVLVGKGITFDTGGISIKPNRGMEEMKADMAGGAAVIGAMTAIGRLKPPRPVIGLVPASENMPGGAALKPGDVIESCSGKTIEVLNTDAEGRLILADALAYAVEQDPEGIVDIATLTGACVVALGRVYAGVMGSRQGWVDRVRETAAERGEKVWPLPMDREYDSLVESDIADVRNTGKDQPGAITAAKLLEMFVSDRPWAHMDIAGMAWRKEGSAWVGEGPTGFGVRTLVGLALRETLLPEG